MSRDLKLILPSVLRFGGLLWLGAWLDLANRLLRPPRQLLERGWNTTG